MIPYIFLDLLFHFFENNVNILTGVPMNLYLALGSVEIPTVLSLQSMSMECHVNSSSLSHSLSVACSVQCAVRVSLKALYPSFPDLRVSGGGMGF